MNGNIIIETLRDSVKPHPLPAVFLSGGLDSTIILHHLREKTDEEIHTYTAYWLDYIKNETHYARKVAEHYDTVHHEVRIEDILPLYEKIIPHLDRPRFNLWPILLYRAAYNDLRETVYIGEGMDEHFGGYWEKPEATYQEYWSGVLEWSLPTHQQLAQSFDLRLETPFIKLPIEITLPYFDSKHRNKELLRSIYREYLPAHVIERKKNAGRFPWINVWDTEIEPIIGEPVPDTRHEAQHIIRKWVTQIWLESQS